MAAVTICSDFGAPKNKVWHCFHCFPNLFPMKWWDKMPWSSFSECWAPLPKIFIKVLCIKAKTRNRLLLLLSHSAMSNTCELMDCSPPGFSVHWILQAKILEWVAISFSNAWKWKVRELAQSCPTLSDRMDCSPPGSPVPGILQARTLEWVAISQNLLPTPHSTSLGCHRALSWAPCAI